MATFRERALAVASSRSSGRFCVEQGPISTYFGQNVFTVETMRKYLPAKAFTAVLEARQNGLKIERAIADEIASGMKTWAMERMSKVREASDRLEMLVDDACWPLPKYRELLSL
jgi:glutamine synthetase